MKSKTRTAFTLVELLVVIAIIGIFVSMLLPAVSATRETARRTSCLNKIAQISMALSDYEASMGTYPSGVINESGPIQNNKVGNHHSWTSAILPFMDLNVLAEHIDRKTSIYDRVHDQVRDLVPSSFVCPSDSYIVSSSYAGVHHDVEAPIDSDNHGILFLNSQIRPADITDGSGFTLMVGEKQNESGKFDLGWLSGTRATLRNTGSLPNMPATKSNAAGQADALFVGGFGSHHRMVTAFCFADGNTRFLTNEIDAAVFQRLGHRADGQLLDTREVR